MKDIRNLTLDDDLKKFGELRYDSDALIRPGVYGVCKRDDKLLIVKSELGGFIVGGGVESSESDEECLKRESLEEIGYDLKLEKWLEDIIEYIYVPERDQSYIKTMRFYKIELLDYVRRASEKDHYLMWIDKDDIESSLYLEGQKYILNKYYSDL